MFSGMFFFILEITYTFTSSVELSSIVWLLLKIYLGLNSVQHVYYLNIDLHFSASFSASTAALLKPLKCSYLRTTWIRQ